MIKMSTDSYAKKQAGMFDALSRGFHNVVTSPAFGHIFKGTNLDPSSGLLGTVMNYLEETGITDKDARSLAAISDKMASQFRSLKASSNCDDLPEIVRELMNDISADHSILNMTASNRSNRVVLIGLFDYKFGPFARAYHSYMNKHSNEVGSVDKKALEFGNRCLDTVARSAFDLYHRLDGVLGPIPQGTPICP